MYGKTQESLQSELQAIKDAGLFKKERIIISPQGPVIRTTETAEVLNFVPIIIWVYHLIRK